MKMQLPAWVACLIVVQMTYADICTLEDSEQTCRKKVVAEINAEAKTGVAIELSQKNTGTSTAIGDAGMSTVNDFAPKMRFSTDAGGLNDNNSKGLSLEFTNFLGLGTQEKGHNYKLQIRLGESTLYQPLKEAVNNAERIDALKDQLDDTDNISIGFSYNFVNKKFGRNLQMSRNLFAGIAASVQEATKDSLKKAQQLGDDADEILQNFTEALALNCEKLEAAAQGACFERIETSVSADNPFRQFPDEALARGYMVAYENAVRAEFGNLNDYHVQLKKGGFNDLVELVNNQPQISLTANGVLRGKFVGPDEINATFSYEKGFVNVNSFRRFLQHDCQSNTATCLDAYLTPARRAQLKRGDRVAVSVEYSQTKDYDITLLDDNVALNLDGGKKFIGNVSYGRYLSFSELGAGQTRFELGMSYEDVSGDPNRQDRGMGTATFSQLISNGTVLSVSLVYANKPEFRGDVDKELSANLGLNYKFASDQGF